jgi:hypothetical protein
MEREQLATENTTKFILADDSRPHDAERSSRMCLEEGLYQGTASAVPFDWLGVNGYSRWAPSQRLKPGLSISLAKRRA